MLSGLVSALLLGTLPLSLVGPLRWNAHAAPSAWSLTGSMSTTRVAHSLTLLPSGKVLAAGGQTNTAAATGSAELYDAAARTWTPTGSLTFPRSFHTATLLTSGKVLLAAGFTSAVGVGTPGVTTFAELYDPSLAGTFSSTGALSTARQAHTATLLGNGKVLVVGGINASNTPLASAELYDPVAATWSPTGSLNIARSQHTATLLSTGKVLVAGGASPGFEPTAELYDPVAGTWSRTGNMSTSRANHTATLLSTGKVLAAGGEGPFVASAELYDPVAGTWSLTGSMSTARARYAATLLSDGRVLVEGGVSSTALTALGSAELYNPATGSWSLTGSLNTARFGGFGLTAVRLGDGTALLAGGVSAIATALASAELYQAGPPPGSPLAWGLNFNGQLGDGTTVNRSTPVAVSGLGGVVAISGGAVHSLAVKADGTVWAWGSNAAGQLGDGTNSDHLLPTQVPGLSGVIAVAAGTAHSLALLADGTVRAWGAGNSGQLGNGSFTTGSLTPVQVCATATVAPCSSFLTGVASIAASSTRGANNSVALKSDGTVWTWGENSFGQLGNGTTSGSPTPVQVRLSIGCEFGCPLTNVTAVSVGGLFVLALLTDGTVRAWGANDAGQLGDGTTVSRSTTVQVCSGPGASSPCGGPLSGVTAIAAGGFHGLAARSDGTVVAWGSNGSGQLGTTAPISKWVNTGSLGVSRYFHTAVPLAGGNVLVTGGTTTFPAITPTNNTETYNPATGVWSQAITMGTARSHHFAVVLASGKVLVGGGIGNLASAEIFDPTTGQWTATGSMNTPRYANVAVLLPNGKVLVAGGVTGVTGVGAGPGPTATAELFDPATGIWTPTTGSMNTARFWVEGFSHSAVLLPTGKVLVTGGTSGLGFGGVVGSAELFDPATGTWSLTGSMATARTGHTATLLQNGKVLIAGGVGSNFAPVVASSELYDPAAGTFSASGALNTGRYAHTAALLTTGQVLAAGGFFNGAPLTSAELYDPVAGTWSATDSMNNARFVHTATALANGKVLIAGGTNNAVALASSELYNPGTLPALTPVPVSGLGGVVALSAGPPLPVSGLGGVVALSAGQFSSYALQSNGAVFAWGDNTSGQLGNGNTINQAVPVSVQGPLTATAIAAGRQHALALRIPALRGVAQCGGAILPAATVQLFSGGVLVATTTAAPDGSWQIAGAAPNATYDVRYTLSVPSLTTTVAVFGPTTTVTCGVTVTTDASGAGVAPVPPTVPNNHDHTWLTPCTLTPSLAFTDFLTRFNQSVWCKLAISPQQRVAIRLDPPAGKDYTLTLFRDLRQVAAGLLGQTGSLAAIQRLTASLAHDVSIDDVSIDDVSIDDVSIDDVSIDDVSIDDVSIDDVSIDDVSIDDVSIGWEQDFAANAAVYKAAQAQGLIGIARRPAGAKTIVFNSRNRAGFVYLRVHGKAGVFDPGNAFTLLATVAPSATCGGAPLNKRPPSTTASGVGASSLILTNSARLGLSASSTPTAAQFVGTPPATGAPATGTLWTLATHPAVNGVVVDLANDANITLNYSDWDANKTCVAQANVVADSIRDLVDAFRGVNPSIQSVVLVGGDRVIPNRRIIDHAELANENRFNPQLDPLSAGEAALGTGYFITNDFYVSHALSRFADELYLPEIAVSRLVESPADIISYVNVFTAGTGTVQLAAAPGTPIAALSTGYSFTSVLANAINSELVAAGVGVDSSLTQPLLAGSLPAGPTDPGAWSADALRGKLLAGGLPHYGVISLQGHFSANKLVPADNGSRLLSSEIAAVTDGRFKNSLAMSVGCHDGFSLQTVEETALTQPTVAFPAAFVGQGATLVGQAGYGYGDTLLLKNSESLMFKFTHELRFNDVTVGRALANAKAGYIGELGALRGIDYKVAMEATLYGVPNLSVRVPNGITRPVAPTPLVTTGSPKFTAGLSTTDVTPQYTLNLNTFSGGSFYDAGGGDRSLTQTIPFRPILPRATTPVAGTFNAAPTLARGAVLLSGSFTDQQQPPFTPLTAVPVSEFPTLTPGMGPGYITPVFDPALPWYLNDIGGQTLVVTPFQYQGGPTSGTGRAYANSSTSNGIKVRVYYSNLTDTRALADAPRIFPPALSVVSGKVHVDVVVGAQTQTDVEDVWVTSTATSGQPLAGKWTSTQAAAGAQTSNAVVGGTTFGFLRHYTLDVDPLGGDPMQVLLFIQAAGGNGLVSTATNNGAYFSVVNQLATLGAPKATTTLALTTPPTTATYRSRITLNATLTDTTHGVALGGRQVTFKIGGGPLAATALAITGSNGIASVQLPVNVEPNSPGSPLYRVTAAYDGDAGTLASSDQSNLTVTQATPVFTLTSPTITFPTSVSAWPSGSADIGTLSLPMPPPLATRPLNEQPLTLTLADTTLPAASPTCGSAVPQPCLKPTTTIASLTDGIGHVHFDTQDFGGVGPGSYQLTVNFPGNNRYLPAVATVSITVKAPVTVAFASAPQPMGTITLSSQVTPTVPCAVCDLTRAQLSYVLTPDVSTLPTLTAAASVAASGTSTVQLANVAAAVYTVTTTVTGGFYLGNSVDIFAVFDPTHFVTGGGFVITPQPTTITPPQTTTPPVGQINASTLKANFGFNLKYLSGTTTPTGSVLFHINGANVDFKATSFDWLVISSPTSSTPGRAELEGSGNLVINGVAVTCNGACKFHAIAVVPSSGSPTFAIFLWNSSTGSFQNPDILTLASQALGGGNIVIH